MPHYDYRCRDCGHKFECFQSMSDDKLTECPECGGHLERLIGAGAGLIFKGSGFYVTDYRTDSYRKAARADKSPPPTSTSSSKSDGKKKSGGSTKSSDSQSGSGGGKSGKTSSS